MRPPDQRSEPGRQWIISWHSVLRHQAAGCLCQRVAAGTASPWSFRPPGTRLRKDNTRVNLPQILETESQPFEHARAVVGQQNVIGFCHPAYDIGTIVLFKIDGNASLASIHGI